MESLLKKEGMVSLWAGKFSEAQSLEGYLTEKHDDEAPEEPISVFAGDIGVGFYDHDFLEAHFQANPESKWEDVLALFSYGKSFSQEALGGLRSLGLLESNALVLLYDHVYKNPTASGRLSFVGTFSYQKT